MAAHDLPEQLLQGINTCLADFEAVKAQVTRLQGKNKLGSLTLDGLHHRLCVECDDVQKWKRTFELSRSNASSRPNYPRFIRDAISLITVLIEGNLSIIQKSLRDADATTLEPAKRDNLELGMTNAVRDIDQSIKDLQTLYHNNHQDKLTDDIEHVFSGTGILPTTFKKKIRAIPPDFVNDSFKIGSRQLKLPFEDLDWFWRALNIPFVLADVSPPTPDRVRIANQWSQGDGDIILDEHVTRARQVSQAFVEAWTDVVYDRNKDFPLDEDLLHGLTRLPKVMIVLHITHKQSLFKDFIVHEKTDQDMDRYADLTVGLLRHDRDYIKAQYHRANRRPWNHGTILEAHPYEPLPLVAEKAYAQDVYVERVSDAWVRTDRYVRKRSWEDPARHRHNRKFKNELDYLRSLGNDFDHSHHFISITKSYVRGRETGILIHPVADENLNELLERCSSHPMERLKFKDSLMQAFGCLSYSMCYLHNVKGFRHGDIRPHNILVLHNQNNLSRFIWSDFGLACGLARMRKDSLDNSTRHEFLEAMPRYQPPEVQNNRDNVGTASTDIFALGCVFLEIISVLLMPPKDRLGEIPAREYEDYRDKIEQIDKWAEAKKAALSRREIRESYLRKVLKMTCRMIAKDPENRPKIGEVVKELGDHKDGGDHRSGSLCGRCAEMYRRDRRGQPKYPNIFGPEVSSMHTFAARLGLVS